METINIAAIRENPNNPRIIRDERFRCLVESIKRDPQFLVKRGLVHADGVILGGNMRYKAILEALIDPEFRERVEVNSPDEIPSAWIQDATDWTDDQKRRFVVIDNSPLGMSGEWDMEMLKGEWELPALADLGIQVNVSDLANIDTRTIEAMEIQPYEHYDYILVLADNIRDWGYLCERLNIRRVLSKEIKRSKRMGLGRCIKAGTLIRLLEGRNDSDTEQETTI